METLQHVFLFLHILGVAAILGGFLAMVLGADVKRSGTAMLHGSLTQLVTGLALVGMLEGPLDETPNHAKVGVKLAILILILAAVYMARRRDKTKFYQAAALGTVLNVGVAVFWT